MANKKSAIAKTAKFSCKYARGIYSTNVGDIKFKDGVYLTSEPNEIDAIKNHPSFGEEIALISDIPSTDSTEE